MDFAEWIREQATKTYTENGAAARNTTGDARLDLFATIGSLRRADPERIELLFAEAYQADPLFALKILFYARDIREGLGERRVFRILLQYLAEYHPQAVIANLDLIGVFGRFDDWYCLIGTGVEDEMWSAMKQQLEADLKNFQEGKSVSLLAKWIKTADSKNTETRKLGILTAQKLGYPVYNFKRIVRSLRKYIGVLEVKISEGKWEEIVYPEVSGRAMMIYRNAFRKHDEKRFNQYLAKALDGKEKIHAETLYPYEFYQYWRNVADADVLKCIRMLTFLPLEEIDAMDSWEGAQLNKAKEILAFELTKMVHGEDEAKKAENTAKAIFTGGDSADMPGASLTEDAFKDGIVDVITLVHQAGLASSRSEARRAVQQGGISVNGEKVTEIDASFAKDIFEGEGAVLKKGKKTFRKVTIS